MKSTSALATTQRFNRVVASLVSHDDQSVAPDTQVVRVELASLAIATASPCGALPPKLSVLLSQTGLHPWGAAAPQNEAGASGGRQPPGVEACLGQAR